MDAPVKRPRGRPPKVKRGGLKLNGPRNPENARSSDSGPPMPSTSSKTGEMASEPSSGAPAGGSGSKLQQPLVPPEAKASETPTRSKRPSLDRDHEILPTKRIRTEPSDFTPNLTSDLPVPDSISAVLSAADRKAIATAAALPARRSTRHATVQATQISEGTLRPPGPPQLEAALGIALRNLESETWRYLWIYYKKHQGEPLPTPAAIKAASPQVRKAAEIVDKADRELEEAIDEIMRSAKKRRRGRPPSRKQSEQILDAEIGDRRSSSLSEAEDEEAVEMTIRASQGTSGTSSGPQSRRSQLTRVAKTT